MYYLKRTNQDVPAPLGLVDRLHAFRSESLPVAQRAADSFRAESGHNITVEERRDVYTTQTLDEAMKRPAHGGSIMGATEYAKSPAKWPDPHTLVVMEDGTKKEVRVGDHTPEPVRTLADRSRVPSNFND